jgi:adenosylhomocysteinase
VAGFHGTDPPPLHPQGELTRMTDTAASPPAASSSSGGGDGLPAHDVTDLGLASEGVRRIDWAEREMPVLRLIRERFEREQPLAGIRIGACLHVTTETANLMRTLKAGGAEVFLAASNPLSTKDDVAAALVAEYGIATFARRGEDRDTYYKHLNQVADTRPQITMDDGCDLVSLLHSERPDQVKEVLAGTEETTTGVIRLKAMAADNALGFPVVAVNEAQTKHLFDNRYGTGQSTIDGILRATNILLAGRNVVIAGYGWVGKGIASRMSGMGAHVAVIEVDPVRALEALMDGFRVMTAGEAAPWGQLFVTATGNVNVFRREHFAAMQEGTVMANSGHFDAELDLKALREMAEGHVRDARENVQEFDLGGKKINLIAEGRLVNLGAAEGHPAAVMDMSFANQALSAEYVVQHHAELTPQVYVVPEAIDAEVARLKLAALGITLDEMTAEQKEYVSSWQHGT